MKLYKVREAATWVDPFGDKHSHLTQYVYVVEVVEVEPNGDVRTVNNGYETWEAPVVASVDGRTWLRVDNRVDYWGGTWYRPLFKELRDPGLLPYEVGPRYVWLTERDMRQKRCVNREGKAVDLEGNPL